MALRVATVAAVVGVAASTINLSFEDCGDSATHGHVTGISPSSVAQGTKTFTGWNMAGRHHSDGWIFRCQSEGIGSEPADMQG